MEHHLNSDYASLKLLLILALLFTLLNAFKPLCIDDAAYYYYAKQIAQHPLEPYGFIIFWYDRPEPAIQILAPVLMQYWWAIAIRLFGEHPFLWKLWLLPFALLLVFSLHSLLRRFAAGHEMILTWMIILSPVFLPSFNLMLDVPMMALSLSALVIFLHASDRDSLRLAALAGLVAGIAAQTKYNGLVTPAVMLLHAIIFKRVKLGVVAALTAVLFFVSWEGFVVLSAGRSHFLAQSEHYGSVNLLAKSAHLMRPLVTIIGAVAPACTLLALAALGARRKTIIVAAGIIILGYLAIVFVPERFQVMTRDQKTNQERLTLGAIVFFIYGIGSFATLIAVIGRVTTISKGHRSALRRWTQYRVEWFLVAWLAIEIVAYFVFSPFPAVRRVLALLVVSTLLIGRLIARNDQERKSLYRGFAWAGIVLGLIFYLVDFRDAYVEKAAAQKAAERISETGSGNIAWYVGRWGFQYYAEHAGMKPLLPDESTFQPGDQLAIPDGPYFPQPLAVALINRYRIEPVSQIVLEDQLPLQTMMGYYSTGIPMRHHEGPRRKVTVYRIVGPAEALP